MEFVTKSKIQFSWQAAPVVRLLLPYVFGIAWGLKGVQIGDLNLALVVWTILLLLYSLSYIWIAKRSKGYISHSLLLFLVLFLLGWISAQRNQPAHRFFVEYHDSFDSIKGYIVETGKESPRYTRYTFRLVEGYTDGQSITLDAKAYLYLRKDSLDTKDLQYGQTVVFTPQMSEIPKPLNPHEFDYQSFSNIRGIYYQQFLNRDQYDLLDESNGYIIIQKARQLRAWVVEQYRRYIYQGPSFEIASALVLGYRGEMSRDTFDLFSNTGTIHILSVSGMHVGMLFTIVYFLFYPFSRRVRLILCLLIIWAYVLFTGMSPSVLRAGTMISFYVFGKLLYRHARVENTLLVTAFILLLINPSSLFDIGFQLSFLAVGGILLFFPLLKTMYYPQNKWGQSVVNILYISLAAQIFTTPLTLFYFERFPNLFLIANLFVVFPASLLMSLGLALPLLPIEILKVYVGKLIILITKAMEKCLLFLDSYPYAVTKGLIISFQEVLLLYAVFWLIPIAIRDHSRQIIALLCTLIVSLIAMHSYKEIRRTKGSEFRIYNVGRNLAISAVANGKVILLTGMDTLNASFIDYQVLPNLNRWSKAEDIKSILINDQNAIIQLDIFKCQIWQQKAPLTSVEEDVDVILIRYNAVLDFSYLAEELNARALYVFDSTNSDEYIEASTHLLAQSGKKYYILKNNYSYVWEEV